MHPAMQTLLRALPDALNLLPEGRLRIGFINASLHEGLQSLALHDLVCEQPLRPLYTELAETGFNVAPTPLEGVFDAVLVLGTRQNEENQYNLARAMGLVRPGGLVVAAQHNTMGAARLQDGLQKLAGGALDGVLTKHHARAVWARQTDQVDHNLKADWLAAGRLQQVAGCGLLAQPGLFSWRQVDRGSELLARHLPAQLAGCGADIGAGWGYLTHQLLSRTRGITHMTLLEAESRALDAARKNLDRFAETTTLDFVWRDINEGLPTTGLDFVISNPPQHDDTGNNPNLTASCITQALRALKKGGTLYVVLNRHLPYEKLLNSHFASVTELCTAQDGFKVYAAVR